MKLREEALYEGQIVTIWGKSYSHPMFYDIKFHTGYVAQNIHEKWLSKPEKQKEFLAVSSGMSCQVIEFPA